MGLFTSGTQLLYSYYQIGYFTAAQIHIFVYHMEITVSFPRTLALKHVFKMHKALFLLEKNVV